MSSHALDTALYEVSIEGASIPLTDMALAEEVIAQWTLGESQEVLALVTPGQISKLHELLHVKQVQPANTGVYVDRSGKWHAVKQGSVVESGYWLVPQALLRSLSEDEPATMTVSSSSGSGSTRDRDPVCGMLLAPGQEEANAIYQDHTYHFCSDECRKLFLANPAAYLTEATATAR